MKIFISLMLVIFLVGCATASYTVGQPFNVENVNKIENGKTTKQELILFFGEPFTKTPLNATQEKWIYTYVESSAKAQSYVISMKVESKGTQQTLDLIIENDVVVNHTFVNGPLQQVNVN